MYRIHQIKLGLDEEKYSIPYKIKKELHLMGLEITDWRIVRESIDARKKDNIKLVYTVDFDCKEPLNVEKLPISIAPDLTYHLPKVMRKSYQRPVVIGFGPCGMFAALMLADAGMRPIVWERGKAVEERMEDIRAFREKGILNPDSNYQFGEGGAGTFSDGKLTTGIKDPRIRKVLEVYANAGGGKEILYKQHPHLGTDVLQEVVRNIRETIIERGGDIHFSTKLKDIEFENKEGVRKVCAVTAEDGTRVETDDVILATGHSARDVFYMLADKDAAMEQKPFSIGVRIQHPQSLINRVQYGDEVLAERLGAAEYKLSHHCKNGRGVYTFCMCPGGEVVVTSSEEGEVVTNGMSNRKRDGRFANSGLLTDVRTSDFQSEDPLAGIAFQEKYERLAYKNGGSNFTAPQTTWKDFKKACEDVHKAIEKDEKKRASLSEPQAVYATGNNVVDSLPAFAADAICEAMPFLARRLRGFDDPRAKMIGVETRSSSPVRILREKDSLAAEGIFGLYPGGEGAGYAGGIVSAAVDGIRIAESIIERE